VAEQLRREKESSTQQATKVVPAGKAGSTTTLMMLNKGKAVVGLAPVGASSAVSNKNQLKKEKAKLLKQRKEEEEAAAAATMSVAEVASTIEDPEKRARKIKKTLKQIDELKSKETSTLNDDQKAKIESEAELRKELQRLGLD
jgi:translation initiation factor 2A